MCNNAMTYNRPETMYYKAAKRLLHTGLKFLSSDKLRQLAFTFPDINLVPADQLGFQIGAGHCIAEYETNILDSSEEVIRKDFSETSPKRKICTVPVE